MPDAVDPSAKFTHQTVTEVQHWTDRLLSFRTTRDQSFRFNAGQYARLGLAAPDGSIVWRPFSMVSAPYDEHLEFLAIKVLNGAFSACLSTLRPGHSLLIDKSAYGFLTLDRFIDGEQLWMLATGTGLAPFISILHSPELWARFTQVVLVHSVRTAAELVYQHDDFGLRDHPLLDNVLERLHYVPVVTRAAHPGAAQARIPALLAQGTLSERTGLALDPSATRIMICGNPDMVRETRLQLKSMGFNLARRERPGQVAIENAF